MASDVQEKVSQARTECHKPTDGGLFPRLPVYARHPFPLCSVLAYDCYYTPQRMALQLQVLEGLQLGSPAVAYLLLGVRIDLFLLYYLG